MDLVAGEGDNVWHSHGDTLGHAPVPAAPPHSLSPLPSLLPPLFLSGPSATYQADGRTPA
ncbi:hypothetical protein GCM10009800_16120 [Nocardiopsis rhodophaea]